MAGLNLFDRTAWAPDDRGAVVSLLNTRELARSGEPRRVDLARHLEAAIGAESRKFTLWSFLYGMGLILGFAALQGAVSVAGLNATPFVRPVSFFGGIVAVIALSRGAVRRRAARGLAATTVAEGVCGSCGYSLRALVAEGDGCIVCPECGAAWRAIRITRPHWDEARPARPPGRPWWRRFLARRRSSTDRMAADDRGRFVLVPDSRLRALPAERRRELGPEIGSLRRVLRRTGRIGRGIVASLGLALSSVLGWVAAQSVMEGNALVIHLVPLSAAVISGLCAAGTFLGEAFIAPARTAHLLRDRSLCGSCAGSLTGLAVDPDGCVACPDCGAAWRVAPPLAL